jgi:hypothetical protein
MDGMGVRRLDKARQAPDETKLETPHTSLWFPFTIDGEQRSLQDKCRGKQANKQRAGRWEMR